MGFFVGGAQGGGADVGVDLSGAKALVAEKLLDAADVGAAVHEMGGEAVAQRGSSCRSTQWGSSCHC